MAKIHRQKEQIERQKYSSLNEIGENTYEVITLRLSYETGCHIGQ